MAREQRQELRGQIPILIDRIRPYNSGLELCIMTSMTGLDNELARHHITGCLYGSLVSAGDESAASLRRAQLNGSK